MTHDQWEFIFLHVFLMTCVCVCVCVCVYVHVYISLIPWPKEEKGPGFSCLLMSLIGVELSTYYRHTSVHL